MPDLTYQPTPSSDKNSLIKMLAVVFVVFLIIGALIGYVSSLKLNKNEQNPTTDDSIQTTAPVTFQGVVTYLGEDMYINDGITYSLTDSKGDDIILLKSNDQKLSIAQGLFVTVTGKKGTTIDGKNEVLQVLEVTLKNDTN